MIKHRIFTGFFFQFATIFSSLCLFIPVATAQPPSISKEVGYTYTVEANDTLYSLSKKFYGKASHYALIVKAHNIKAANDSRYQPIPPQGTLAIGQLLWIPMLHSGSPQNAEYLEKLIQSPQQLPYTKPSIPHTKPPVQYKPPISDTKLPVQRKPPVQHQPPERQILDKELEPARQPSSDPFYIVNPPKTNCEIHIWYNFQLVAIKKLNERWVKQGISLIERAERAFFIRREAKLNARYMMQDRFEVAALRDNDSKNYGDPNGPSFADLVAKAEEQGFSGSEIYENIIDNTAKIVPVSKNQCQVK